MDTAKTTAIATYFAPLLGQPASDVESVLVGLPTNVQIVLARQIRNDPKSLSGSANWLKCRVQGEEAFLLALQVETTSQALFTLARVYDAAHIAVCKNYANAKRGRHHQPRLLEDPCLDIGSLTDGLMEDKEKIQDDIQLMMDDEQTNILRATWTPVVPMSFDQLPVLESLSSLLPGESTPSLEYAGIGGGGGSDIVSASLLGQLLRRSSKEMNLLISTRTWRTGSQGKKGSKLGVKREVYRHGGLATLDGVPIAGTFRIKAETYSEGRDLETVPVPYHEDIFLVLDQGDETTGIPEHEKAELITQYRAVLSQRQHIDTIIVVDTGGDVFGSNFSKFSTPDQDIRVQRAVSHLSDTYLNLVTAVLAPGVDAPIDTPEKAAKAGGRVYKLNAEEKAFMLDLLGREYQMDGSNPSRFGKTTLCLQACLKGERGWTSLNLPSHVVDTWENPWSIFAYIRDCMADVVLMPLRELLPLIADGGT